MTTRRYGREDHEERIARKTVDIAAVRVYDNTAHPGQEARHQQAELLTCLCALLREGLGKFREARNVDLAGAIKTTEKSTLRTSVVI